MKRKKNIQTMSPEAAEYMENLWEVWQQWQSAKSMFEQAVDPDMVEFAIYNMEARKKQFNYSKRKSWIYNKNRRIKRKNI